MLGNFLGARNGLDPSVNYNVLDRVASHIQNVSEYFLSGDRFWLEGALEVGGPVYELAETLRTVPMTSRGRLSGLGRQAEETERALLNMARRSDHEMQAVRERYENILEELRAEAMLASEEIAKQQSEAEGRLQGLNESVSKANEMISLQLTRLDKSINNFSEQFSEEEQKRAERWKASLVDTENQVKKHLEEMIKHEESSERVLQSLGVKATVSSYSQYAKEQKQAADRWRGIAVGAFICAFAWFILSSFGIAAPETDGNSWWVPFVSKWGGTLAAAAVGAFAGRESGQHRREERDAKQVELSLAALDPFIANMSDATQEDLRTETARAIFVLERKTSKEPELDSRSGAAEGVASKAIDLATETVRRVNQH